MEPLIAQLDLKLHLNFFSTAKCMTWPVGRRRVVLSGTDQDLEGCLLNVKGA